MTSSASNLEVAVLQPHSRKHQSFTRAPETLEKAGSSPLCRVPGCPAHSRGCPWPSHCRSCRPSIKHEPHLPGLALLQLSALFLAWRARLGFMHFSRRSCIDEPIGLLPGTKLSATPHGSLLISCHSAWLEVGSYLRGSLV